MKVGSYKVALAVVSLDGNEKIMLVDAYSLKYPLSIDQKFDEVGIPIYLFRAN